MRSRRRPQKVCVLFLVLRVGVFRSRESDFLFSLPFLRRTSGSDLIRLTWYIRLVCQPLLELYYVFIAPLLKDISH